MKVHPITLEFLQAIKEHNSRKYFASARELYDEIWENMQEISAELIQRLSKIDPDYSDLKPKETLFRIYRDARRIKDGDPIYKENLGMALSPGGKKSQLPTYYFHIHGGNQSFIGGGLYWADPKELNNLRYYLKKHGAEYEKLISEKKFKKFFGTPRGESLTRPPRGFEKTEKYIDLIMMKQHLISCTISDKDLLHVDITDRCMERIEAAKPWMDFLTIGCTTPLPRDAK